MKYLPLLAAPRTGRVTLRTTSSAPVRVDGLLLGRSSSRGPDVSAGSARSAAAP